MLSLLGDHLLQRLQKQTEGALYHRVFCCLRDAITEGILPPKTRLPASRDLAHELKVSRNTILNAYEHLQAQGYIQAHTGRGSWVAENLPESYLTVPGHEHLAEQPNQQQLKHLSKRGTAFLESAAASLSVGCFCAERTRRYRISTRRVWPDSEPFKPPAGNFTAHL